MPELPEVETIVRDLARLLPDAVLGEVSVLRPDLLAGPPERFVADLEGARIVSVDRRAKNIVFTLEPARAGADRLVVNLGMTGRLLVVAGTAAIPSHVGVRFTLRDGRRLLYQDVRRFGRLEVLTADEWTARSDALGPEPLSDAFTPASLYDATRASRVAIKTWLMDQRRVVGVGNLYASEALFRARISPRRAARRILKREAAALHAAIREVLEEAIDFRGTTLLDYRDAAGERGEFARRLRVYDRKGEPCVRCGTPVRRIVQGGRSTFYCPSCQK